MDIRTSLVCGGKGSSMDAHWSPSFGGQTGRLGCGISILALPDSQKSAIENFIYFILSHGRRGG
jgi:hypothetical protein